MSDGSALLGFSNLALLFLIGYSDSSTVRWQMSPELKDGKKGKAKVPNYRGQSDRKDLENENMAATVPEKNERMPSRVSSRCEVPAPSCLLPCVARHRTKPSSSIPIP